MAPFLGALAGMAMRPCDGSLAGLQRWSFSGTSLQLAAAPAAGCAAYGGNGVPLTLQQCDASDPAQAWAWDAASGAVVLAGSDPAVCFNVRTLPAPGSGGAQPGAVGGYFPCGDPEAAPRNEVFTLAFARDAAAQGGLLVSGMNGTWAGQCVTAPAPAPPPPSPTPPTPTPAASDVWPLPRHEQLSGPPLALATGITVAYTGPSAVATDGAARYTAMLRRKVAVVAAVARAAAARGGDVPAASDAAAAPQLSTLTLTLETHDDTLVDWTTNESYVLRVGGGAATATARTPFGGLRALETFYQLVTSVASGAAALPHGEVLVRDSPGYGHRALMIDTGRRLYPVALVKSILDAMSYAKLNVLHLHLNDMGRLAWESRVFPELNRGYCVLGECDGTYWSQAEVRDMVAFAKLRGVRLVPELEMSTHARALAPLAKSRNLTFCNETWPIVIFDDEGGVARAIIKALLAEMAGLFEDEVVHLGMDEAQCHYSEPSSNDPLDVGMCGLQQPAPRCNAKTVRSLQHAMLEWAASPAFPAALPTPRPLRPMVWHNAYTDCGDLNGCALPDAVPPSTAGVPSAIVEVFAGSTIGTTLLSAEQLLENVTAAGLSAVMADVGHLYLDTGSPDPAIYFELLWYDVAAGLAAAPAAQRARLMGGSMSLWSDNYCSGRVECGGWALCPAASIAAAKDTRTCVPPTGWMQDAAQNAAFELSVGGLLWPRANVGAGAFWHFNGALASNSTEVLRRTSALAASMEERGVVGICPHGCSCSFGDRCGTPYTPS